MEHEERKAGEKINPVKICALVPFILITPRFIFNRFENLLFSK